MHKETLMRFPYAISYFRKIITKGYSCCFYCDRTDRIPLLEKTRAVPDRRIRLAGKGG